MKYGVFKTTPRGNAIESLGGGVFLIMPNSLPANLPFVEGEKVVFDVIPSAIPGRSFARNFRKPSFAELNRFTRNIVAPVVHRPVAIKPTVAQRILPSRANWTPAMTEAHRSIMQEIVKWNKNGYWYSNGPTGNTVWIGLPIRGKEVKQVHAYLKADLVDRAIPKPHQKKQLYCYVTGLNTPLKKGFRITGHSYLKKDIAKKGGSATFGVLHIDSQR